jgi:hypothetical protein
MTRGRPLPPERSGHGGGVAELAPRAGGGRRAAAPRRARVDRRCGSPHGLASAPTDAHPIKRPGRLPQRVPTGLVLGSPREPNGRYAEQRRTLAHGTMQASSLLPADTRSGRSSSVQSRRGLTVRCGGGSRREVTARPRRPRFVLCRYLVLIANTPACQAEPRARGDPRVVLVGSVQVSIESWCPAVRKRSGVVTVAGRGGRRRVAANPAASRTRGSRSG